MPSVRTHRHASLLHAPALVLWALAVALTASGCGAEDLDAPETSNRDHCPSLDQYLGGVYGLVEQGQLDHLKAVLEDGLTEDTRRDLIETAVRLVSALEPGTFVRLGEASLQPGDTGALQDLLADVVLWITDVGPSAPYPEVLAVGRAVIGSCDGPPLLQLVLDLLHDDQLLAAVSQALSGDIDVSGILDRLDAPDGDPRAALRQLVHNALVAATDPVFDVREWTGLLSLLVDTGALPWDGLVAAVEGALGPGQTLVGVQALVVCLLAVDPDLVSVDLVYDLLVAPPARRIDRAPLAAAFSGGGPLVPPELDAPLTLVLEHVRDHAEDRCTLATVLGAVLAPADAPAVLREVAWFLESHALGGVVDALVALARRECAP